MAFEWRDNQDGMYGRLSAGIAVNETTISAPELINMPAMATGQTTRYVPIVVYTPLEAEIMWAYEHQAGDTTMKVARGKQGTDPRQWLEQTDWGCMTTDWDLLPSMTRADLAAIEPFQGMRVYLTDEGATLERAGSKWLPSSGLVNPTSIGPGVNNQNHNSNFAVPADAKIELRCAGTPSGVTNVNGERTIFYQQPFPTATICVIFCNASLAGPDLLVVMERYPSGFKYRLLNSSTKAPRNNVVSSVDYIAVGY